MLHQNQLKKLSHSLSCYVFWGVSNSFTLQIFSLTPAQPLFFCLSFFLLNLSEYCIAKHMFWVPRVKCRLLKCSTLWLNEWRNEFSCYATSRHFIFLSLWGRAENRFNWPSFCQRTFKVEIKMKWMMHLVHVLAWRWNCTKPQFMSSKVLI